MFLPDLLFYLFSFVLVSSAIVVVGTKNTVHSVMFLILAFFNAAGLFILLGAEFLAMLLVIVYVGAIAVLFLFVVMMLDLDHGDAGKPKKYKFSFNKYALLATIIGAILFIEMFLITQSSTLLFGYNNKANLPIDPNITNSQAIGNVIYTDFILPFQIAGAVLFVAMIGAIVLTLRDQDRYLRKQNIAGQVSRQKDQAVELKKVKSGSGVNV